jgi:preprotein translocase subunit SecF
VLIALFFLGGPVIHDFAFALLVGIVVGTYSSIFIASPIVLLFENLQLSKMKRKK